MINRMSGLHDLKEYFNFNRGERRGLVILLSLLVATIIFGRFMPVLIPEKTYDFTEFEHAAKAFESRQAWIRDSLEQQNLLHQNEQEKSMNKPSTLTPFPFDPNDLPANKWLEIGLSEKQVRVIKNYEKKGGYFRTPDDLRKIYSLSEEEFQALRPFIRIPQEHSGPKNNQTVNKVSPDDSAKHTGDSRSALQAPSRAIPGNIILELNRADSTDLQQLPGIGPSFGARIMKYRQLLGGYIRKEQLMEIYGMDSIRYAGIVEHLSVDSSLVRKVNLNAAGIKELMKHPYIEFYLAKTIVNYRNKQGGITSVDSLRKSAGIPRDLMDKILPYLEL